MYQETINDIKQIIQKNSLRIPAGYKFWLQQKIKESDPIEKVLQVLIALFEEEERAIKIDRSKSFVTDNYENDVRHFATILVKRLTKYHSPLDGSPSYMELLGQKHMAYAFYHVLDSPDTASQNCHIILDDAKYTPYLYHGLTQFYSSFYGSFRDNEEAIRLLCKYYPKENDSWLDHEEVINALLDHIWNAGTATDLGHAYHGIEQIQQHIHGLPDQLILELLKQYRLYDVLNQKISRHQIFAIIYGSGLTEHDKQTLKFFYLDSLLLADVFNSVWVEKENNQNTDVEFHYHDYDHRMEKKRIQVLNKPDAYWDNEYSQRRLFWIDGKSTAGISLRERTTVTLLFGDRRLEFPFIYKDWILQDLLSKATREKIYQMVSNDSNVKLRKNQMTFSLLYLDEYRGLKNRTLDFDHRFTFCADSGEVKGHEKERNQALHFYGESIYSLTCIVGKNGKGKTSIVDFLRDTFYKMLKILEDRDIPCLAGYVESDHLADNKILDKSAKFLVVFRIGADDYFLTNIPGIHSKNAHPYQTGAYHNIDLCKVAYFFQQMRTDQILRFESGERTKKQDISEKARALNGLGQCDYSEVKSFVLRKNALASSRDTAQAHAVNSELCYQFALLRNISKEKLRECLDIPPEKKFVIYDMQSGEPLDEDLAHFNLDTFANDFQERKYEKTYSQRQEAAIGFFSSGQYAKFMFMAKLYWFLEGYHKESAYYLKIAGEPVSFPVDALLRDESALIFIDEGEVYYHPEWQRKYLSTLLDLLNLWGEKASIQVIFTTNSPFVISDVLKEDVQYLSDQREEFGNTLGQNIHKLLRQNFFMDYTIGEYSRKLINVLIHWMTKDTDTLHIEDMTEGSAETNLYDYFDDTQDAYGMIRWLIRQIGEPIYRDKLENMLDELMESKENATQNRIHELEQQRNRLEKEISRLKGEQHDTNGTLSKRN